MSNFFNSPLLDLIQSQFKTPEQQVQRATSPLTQAQRNSKTLYQQLSESSQNPIEIKPIISARDATGTVYSVKDNPHTDTVPENIEERQKQALNILETMIDFTPIVGDIKGLTFDPIRAGIQGGWRAGLSMAGLGLIGLVPGVGDAAKTSGKILHSAKKANSWRDLAIYLRHWDLRKEWPNFNEEELQKHVSIKPTEKAKDKYLSQTYHGQYTTTPEEQFIRVNNTGNDRVKWIEKHPVKELPNYTTLEEQIHDASRSDANEYIDNFRRSLDENVTYSVDPKRMKKGEIAWTEGSILNGIWGTKPSGKILTIFSKEDKAPFAQLTLGHEAAIHGSGNLDDAYIYQYLKENDIIDFDNVSPYFKNADAGEIGAHLSEVPSYLGFKKETPTSKYQTPEGKTKITKDDIINYNRFQRENGIDPSQTITGNVKNWPKFLEFLNGHKFMWIAPLPLFGIGAAQIANKESYENN